MWKGQTWPGLKDALGGALKLLNAACIHLYLQESDWGWQAWPPLCRWTYRSVGEIRQTNADKHLNLIQTISLCLLQEAPNDRSKRPQACINGSRGSLLVSLVHYHYPRLLLPPSPFSASASRFYCEWPQEIYDLRPQAILCLSSCFTHL